MTAQKKMTAIVTGSGRGIGKEIAKLLAKRGINVVVCSRTESEIKSVVQEIKEMTRDDDNYYSDQEWPLGIKCDVAVSSQVNSLINSTIDKFGDDSIDILINNAGIAFNKKWLIRLNKNGIKQ